ncbi:SLAM family member 5-like [Triplophysa dalaica]|uniref:SLAM family member 5-like n=1 Tax=Triplophysa dalaica TaxID=1582913 RepID=UPI0024DF921C|nr:SLAM family member 5-like [Triplophysa dalaica]
MFHAFIIFCLCLNGVDPDEVKSVSVIEGDSVTLYSGITDIHRDDLILWTFGAKNSHLAKINRLQKEIFHDGDVGRFRERLHMDDQTGSLTITNISIDLTGLYHIEIISGNKVSSKNFTVSVYARLPVPVISQHFPQCSQSSSSSYCSVLCSVMNVTHVSLSWYKENSLLSSISVSDVKTTASLHLEVEYQDNDTYSCVIDNPITNHTQHLNISHVCPMIIISDFVHEVDDTEAMARLVLAVLVAVAAVVLVIYDIVSTRV